MANTLSEKVPLAWADWWRAIAQHSELETRFPARNLILDEGVEAARAESYATYLAAVREPSWPDDTLQHIFSPHRRYVKDRLMKNHGGALPAEIELDETSCPETFLEIPASSPFLAANLDLRLVRVENADGMAGRIGVEVERLLSAATGAVGGDGTAKQTLNFFFETLADKSALRPEFATFHADVDELFALPDWADQLRDSLGLIHLDPAPGTGIDILVFSYPLRDLPSMAGQKTNRPLVPPVVLESGFNTAFCPSPSGGMSGHTIDLSGNTPVPRREVLHPTLLYQANHLFRVGKIRRPVDKTNLEVARGLHLTEIRKQYNRPDYGAGTDSDIV